jgi:4-alpha-glucanotransferase
VVYTGTHDNDTIVGWYEASSTEEERDYARKYLGSDGTDIAGDLIRLAWASVAHTAMTTVQDLLGLGHEARMNTPSTIGPPNWCWRLLPGALTDSVAERLLSLTAIYGRLPADWRPPGEKPTDEKQVLSAAPLDRLGWTSGQGPCKETAAATS